MTISLDSMRMGNHRERRRARWAGVAALLLATAWAALAPATAGAVRYDGNGYRVYICRAAAEQGYAPPLNRVMERYNDRPGQFFLQDSCNNWSSGAPGHLHAYHPPSMNKVWLPNPGQPGAVSAGFKAWVLADSGLAITAVRQTSLVRGFILHGDSTDLGKSTGNSNGYGMGRDAGYATKVANTTGVPAYSGGAPFYFRCGSPTREHPVSPPGTNGDLMAIVPNATGGYCEYALNNQLTTFDPARRPFHWNMDVSCGSGRTGDEWCQYGGPDWFNRVSSLTFYVRDATNPGLTMSPAPGGDGDPDRNGDGVPDETKERFAFNAWDNAGLRRIDFLIDGRLVTRRAFSCIHLYMAPCPGATGVVAGRNPGAFDLSPFEFDVDQLDPAVPHNATIVVVDGAGRVSRAIRPIRVTTRPAQEMQCRSTGPTSLITTLLVPATCQTARAVPEQDASSDSADSVLVGAAPAPTPTKGASIFQYDLAANAFPLKRPLDPGDCRTLNAVMRGSGVGGSLSNTEMNQIITVTIDLNAFFQSTELGQQSTKTTFSLPTRSTARYRSALGCAG